MTSGYIGVMITSLLSPFPVRSIESFDQLTTPVCSLNQSSTSVEGCPKNMWTNSTFHKNRAFRKFRKEQHFHVLSSLIEITASGFLKRLERKKGRARLARRMSDMFLKFQSALTNFIQIRQPALYDYEAGKDVDFRKNGKSSPPTQEDVLMYSLYFPNHTLLPESRYEFRKDLLPPRWEHMLERELVNCERTVWVENEGDVLLWLEHLSR